MIDLLAAASTMRLIEVPDVRCLCADGDGVLMGGPWGVRRLELATGESRELLQVPTFALDASATLLVASSLRTVQVFERGADRLRPAFMVPVRSERVGSWGLRVLLDVSSSKLAIAASEFLLVHEVSVGQVLALEEDPARAVTALAWAPDGLSLVTGHENGAVELRDPTTLDVIGSFAGLSASVLSVAFEREARSVIASCDASRTLQWTSFHGAPRPLDGLGKVVHLHSTNEGALVAVELTRALGVFSLREHALVAHLRPPGFEHQYFQAACVVNERFLAVLVERRGVLLVDLAAR